MQISLTLDLWPTWRWTAQTQIIIKEGEHVNLLPTMTASTPLCSVLIFTSWMRHLIGRRIEYPPPPPPPPPSNMGPSWKLSWTNLILHPGSLHIITWLFYFNSGSGNPNISLDLGPPMHYRHLWIDGSLLRWAKNWYSKWKLYPFCWEVFSAHRHIFDGPQPEMRKWWKVVTIEHNFIFKGEVQSRITIISKERVKFSP